MKHFKNCKTQNELKIKFKELCKQHHPDKGGSTNIMSEINLEYEKLLSKFNKKSLQNNKEITSIVIVKKAEKPAKLLVKKEITPLMNIKKQMLSKVFRKAWKIKTENKKRILTISEAIKKAWEWFKNEKKKGKIQTKQLSII